MSMPQPARITGVVEESARVRTLELDLRLEADPGQFVMAWLPGQNERPFSLVRAEPATLTVARVGPFSEALHSLSPGDRLWLRGPLGRPFSLPRKSTTAARLILVAGGYGVAPLHFLAERATAADWPVSAVIGARTAADVVFAGRFAALGVEVVVTTDDGSAGERGLATEAAARLMEQTAQGRRVVVYACGPEPMLEAVEALVLARGVPAQLSYERTMRCGFGVCGTCVAGGEGWLVCRDGPVKLIPARPGRGQVR
jgi:dihydroorotate dehydrogenase electron transfer subunit